MINAMFTLRKNEASFQYDMEDIIYGCPQARLFFFFFFAITSKLRVMA